jgi:hypothetical protein
MPHYLTSAGFALLSLASVASGAEKSSSCVLVQRGRPTATIVTAVAPSEKVHAAALDLQEYIEKISGARLAMATEAERPGGALVLVGRSRLTEERRLATPSGLTTSRREEAFVIQCAKGVLLLAGNDEGPYHGTEYAVADFLRSLGVRWFMPGEFGEVVPRSPTITVAEQSTRSRPDFPMRDWWVHALDPLVAPERRWKLRNKMNPDPIFQVPGDSSARRLVPKARYFAEHPEYFATNSDGSRNPYLPNLTSPEAVGIAASTIKDYFRQHPEANSYGFAPDDGLPRDFTPTTLKLNQGFVDLEGRPGVAAELSGSEEWFGFVNQVAAQVRQEFPDRYIATNGYANRNLPPQGLALDDHVVVMFAAIWSCTLHAYDDGHCWQKVRQGQLLRRWRELSRNVWVYNYQYQMHVSALTPLPETRKLRRDLPLLKEWGVIGFFDEARNQWMENGIASRYLRAQLLWNAHADAEAILTDFYRRWYGAAAGPARAFYEDLEDAIEKSPMHGHEDRILPEIYTPALMTELERQLRRAESLAVDAPTRRHVRVDRLIYEHLAAYVALSAAEAAGDWAGAVEATAKMMDRRRELHAISPYLVWSDEKRYHSGIWYWGVLDRQLYYQSLAERVSGKTGDLVALLPETARLRLDPRDEGVAGQWYAPALGESDWEPVSSTRPFYVQIPGDPRGHVYLGNLWYRFHVDVPPSPPGRRVLLYAPVVETEAWVWVNGHYVGHRPYAEAYLRPNPLEMDVTDALLPGRKNMVVLRVDTGLSEAQEAGGLQSRLFLYSPLTANRD